MIPNVGNKTGSGTNDNDVVIQFDDIVDGCDTFMLFSTTGAMDVFPSLDGANFATAPYSLFDGGGTSQDPVLVTVAGRMYGFRGKFKAVRVLQNGATAVANAVLRYGTM
jgi:hypothetical protein